MAKSSSQLSAFANVVNEFITYYATPDGYKASATNDGSWMIQSLVKLFKDTSMVAKTPLYEVLRDISGDVNLVSEGKQSPLISDPRTGKTKYYYRTAN